MVEDLPAEAIEALVAAGAIGEGSPLLFVELRQLGGAVSRPAPTDGAVGTLDAAYILFAVGIAPDAEAAAAIESQVDVVLEALAPWHTGRAYFNLVERPTDAAGLYSDGTYARLTRARAQYDPYGIFQANHTIAPA